MNQDRTPHELAMIAIREVEHLIEDCDLCFSCALSATAHRFKADIDKLETLWIDYKVDEADGD